MTTVNERSRSGRKRGHGEGTIVLRADGRWTAALTLADGKRKWFYGRTRREVQDQLQAAQQDRRAGLPAPSGRLTVQQFLTQWLALSAKPRVRHKTYVSYEGTVRLHIVPALGKYQLARLTPERIQALLNAKLATGLAPRSVAYIRTVLRVALGQAVKWNLIGRNPAVLADPPRVEKHRITPLTPDQARTLLAAARGDRLEALYTVALALGLRKGETLGLVWSDVDLDAGTLSVNYQLQRIGGRRLRVPLKTDESRRTLLLPDAVAAALRAHRVRQLEERLAAGDRWQDSGHVLTSAIGTPLDERNVNRSFERLLARARLPHMRFHDLRHSAASLLLAQGVPLRVISELLGHTKIGTTADLYTHLAPTLHQEAAAKMQAVLTGPR